MNLIESVKKLLVPQGPPEGVRLGRNDICWCGSGKKYKNCHLASDERKRAAQRDAARGGSLGGMF